VRARAKRHYGRSAAVTVLVAAAVALLGVSAPQVRLAFGLERSTSPPGPDRTAAEVTEDPSAGAAPAPPQSFSRPADESRPFVPPSAPRLLEAPAIRLRADVTPYTPADVAAHGGAIKPSTLWDVAWWTGGGTPGSHASNTVYLYGHTWKEPAVFNRVKELERGDALYVTTRTGRLRYIVDSSFTVLKTDLTKTPTVAAAIPGRLLLLACFRATGREEQTTRNVVVIAHLA
jgi:LPXTG-site transpeptidase (sortase) family protein